MLGVLTVGWMMDGKPSLASHPCYFYSGRRCAHPGNDGNSFGEQMDEFIQLSFPKSHPSQGSLLSSLGCCCCCCCCCCCRCASPIPLRSSLLLSLQDHAKEAVEEIGMGLQEVWANVGPGLAGAVFGGGWWFWVDAVVCSVITVRFLHYLPGIFASLAALMFNCVRRDELQEYSPYDDGQGCRSRTWLFLAYVISFVSLAGSVGMLVQDALLPDTPDTWTGIAGVLQCTFVLASGLMYWTSRTASDD